MLQSLKPFFFQASIIFHINFILLSDFQPIRSSLRNMDEINTLINLRSAIEFPLL